ncbi:MAG: diguanylate cyclase domain-containing protein [Bacilli bacterium]|jgi:diguanylate cyclase (GGDEF)-like protein
MKSKKDNKTFIYIFLFIFMIVGSFISYKMYNDQEINREIKFNLFEKKWIEKNKNQIINVAILNDVPIFGESGHGVFFSFLDDFMRETELEINKNSYGILSSAPDSDYFFQIKAMNEKLTEKDLLFYEDNYVLLSKKDKEVNSVNHLQGKTIGVLSSDLVEISLYLDALEIAFLPAENLDILLELFQEGDLDFIILPRNIYLEKIIENKLNIVYTFNDLTRKYVLTFKNEEESLNNIIRKYYNMWKEHDLTTKYNEESFSLYSKLNNLSDVNRASFQSKRYIYGYINNSPYEMMKNGEFIGINKVFIDGLANLSNIEITYKEYSSLDSLNKALNNGEVDLAFNYYDLEKIVNYEETKTAIISNYLVLSYYKEAKAIDLLSGLNKENVYIIFNKNLINYFEKNTTGKLIPLTDINTLAKERRGIVVVDENIYHYYKNTVLNDYNIINYGTEPLTYNFLVTKKEDNELLYDLFQYYLSNIDLVKQKNKGILNLTLKEKNKDLSSLWLYIILIPIFFTGLMIIINKFNKIKKGKEISKNKYIDPLTSLKNRYYLNNHINKWEENLLYPQAIVIIDLNNLKDVNDSHGHDEGDRLIKAAASILINNQLEKTDIIRTDGDEFLIYMVGYNDQQVVSYIRKLSRLFKDLPYEQGAAIGYSMILDDIKLIDDAINEAILDMLTNKENYSKNED